MSSLNEKTIAEKVIYSGKVVHLQVDQVELPNGKQATRELIKHPGAVAVIAFTSEERLLLVRQYRKALERVTLEIPAGKLEAGEEPLLCAQRELAEETGYQAREWKHLVSFYTSPGFADEYVHLYVAEDLIPGTVHPDPDEFVEQVELTWEECQEALQNGEICDAKTVATLYWWQLQRR